MCSVTQPIRWVGGVKVVWHVTQDSGDHLVVPLDWMTENELRGMLRHTHARIERIVVELVGRRPAGQLVDH